jgi:hypothetical protein
LLTALRLTVRSGLAGIWVRGQIPVGPAVLAANHHSWWDPFVAVEVVTRARRRPTLLMDAGQLHRYRFARPLGVIGADEPRSGLALLRDGGVLVLYPEGRLLPAGTPAPLAAGASWFARQAPARLCSAAVRVLLRGGQFGEAYVVLSEVQVTGTRETVTRRLSDQLRHDLAGLDRLNATTDPRQPLPGLRLAVRGRRSWDERVDAAPGWRRPDRR